MSVAFLESISLEKILPCLAEPGKIIVVGTPSRDLAEVIPFLAALPNTIAYNPQPPSLTLRRTPGLITLQPDRVSITQAADVSEGMQLLVSLVEAINATWEHRAELVAVTSRRLAPKPLDVWAFLPQTNCGRCGELTCMALAFGLLQQRRAPADCPVLTEDNRFADRLDTLTSLFGS
jgi:ArsR family metal-binding transcriptional regulator